METPLRVFPLRPRTRPGIPLSPLNSILWILAILGRQEKSNTGIQIGKEAKPSLFAVDGIVELGDLRGSTMEFGETIQEFSKGAGYRVACQRGTSPEAGLTGPAELGRKCSWEAGGLENNHLNENLFWNWILNQV